MTLPGVVVEAVGLQAVVTGSTGSGKSWWVERLAGEYLSRGLRSGVVVVDRSAQHAPWVRGDVVEVDRAAVDALAGGGEIPWVDVLAGSPRLLVVVSVPTVDALPVLDGLGRALWEVGDRLLVVEEAQRVIPRVGGSREFGRLPTDARKRALDWVVVSPQVKHPLGGVSDEWLREAYLWVTFSVDDPRQVEVLGAHVPAWAGELGSLRPLQRDGGRVRPPEYLVWDRRARRAGRVDLASGGVRVL